MRVREAEDVCSSVAASERGGDLYLFVDLCRKAVENRYINTTGKHMHKYAVCTFVYIHTHAYTPQRIWPCLPPLSWAVESPSLLSLSLSSLSSLPCALTLSG